ncbi:22593_t:CDS:2, partial [Gigaspora rosea]
LDEKEEEEESGSEISESEEYEDEELKEKIYNYSEQEEEEGEYRNAWNSKQLLTDNTFSSKSNSNDSLVRNNEERSYNSLTAFSQHRSFAFATSHKLVSPFIGVLGEPSPMIFLEDRSDESDDSRFEWYCYMWNNKVLGYKVGENDSDLDDSIDEARRKEKLERRKAKPFNIKCHSDLAGNTYLEERNVEVDLPGEENKKRNIYNLEYLKDWQRRSLQKLLKQNMDLFVWEAEKLGKTNVVKYYISTGNALSIKKYPYHYSPKEKGIIKDELSQMLREGLIQPCESPWTSPVVLPLPCIQDLLDALNGSSWYSSLELASGYWQVEVDKVDKIKTAFTTPFGDLIGEYVVVSLMTSIYFPELLLRCAGLKLKPSKCFFARRELKFLGHVISGNRIATDSKKKEAVKNFPIPRNLRQLRGFLGLITYYRKFIKDFTHIAVNFLLKKNVSYKWTNEQQEAFEALKNKLITTP